MKNSTAEHLSRADKKLAAIIKQVGACPLKPRRGVQPWQALVRSVAFQQLNGNAAQTILNRFLALFCDTKFPTPEQIVRASDAQLRSAGLSGAKTAAIKDIAAKTIAGVVPDRRAINKLSDAEIIERLTTIRGVGPWTVEMLLMFTLGRPDVLPATDYGVRNGFAILHGLKELPPPKELLAYGERWRPHRSAAAWYLWRVVDIEREKILRTKRSRLEPPNPPLTPPRRGAALRERPVVLPSSEGLGVGRLIGKAK